MKNKMNKSLKHILTKEFLIQKYYKEKISMRDISRIIGCGETVIWKYMNIFGLKRRSRRNARIGYKHSMETRQKLADIKKTQSNWRGSKNPNWKGGITMSKNKRMVSGIVYWKNSVLRRDDFVCQLCGVDGKLSCTHCGENPQMHAHHIVSWEESPDLRLDIDNGICLCKKCHLSLHGKRGELLGSPKKDNQQPSQSGMTWKVQRLEAETRPVSNASTSALPENG